MIDFLVLQNVSFLTFIFTAYSIIWGNGGGYEYQSKAFIGAIAFHAGEARGYAPAISRV